MKSQIVTFRKIAKPKSLSSFLHNKQRSRKHPHFHEIKGHCWLFGCVLSAFFWSQFSRDAKCRAGGNWPLKPLPRSSTPERSSTRRSEFKVLGKLPSNILPEAMNKSRAFKVCKTPVNRLPSRITFFNLSLSTHTHTHCAHAPLIKSNATSPNPKHNWSLVDTKPFAVFQMPNEVTSATQVGSTKCDKFTVGGQNRDVLAISCLPWKIGIWGARAPG